MIKEKNSLFCLHTSSLKPVVNQPPNSPDTNINDLAFFASLQSQQVKRVSYSREELIHAVTAAYEAYESVKLDNAFLTLQCCFNSILEAEGGNDYKLTHMGKARLERQVDLPVSNQVPDAAAGWIVDSDSDE
jgi:hypothetical protein